MSSSGLTDLSSSLSSDDSIAPISKGKLENYFTHGSDATPTSPPAKKKRPSSPPHEYVLADNPDVGVSTTDDEFYITRDTRIEEGLPSLILSTCSSFVSSARALVTFSQNRWHNLDRRI